MRPLPQRSGISQRYSHNPNEKNKDGIPTFWGEMNTAGHKGCRMQDRFPVWGSASLLCRQISKSFLVFGGFFFSTSLQKPEMWVLSKDSKHMLTTLLTVKGKTGPGFTKQAFQSQGRRLPSRFTLQFWLVKTHKVFFKPCVHHRIFPMYNIMSFSPGLLYETRKISKREGSVSVIRKSVFLYKFRDKCIYGFYVLHFNTTPDDL